MFWGTDAPIYSYDVVGDNSSQGSLHSNANAPQHDHRGGYHPPLHQGDVESDMTTTWANYSKTNIETIRRLAGESGLKFGILVFGMSDQMGFCLVAQFSMDATEGWMGGQCPTWIYSLRWSIITIIQNEDLRNYFYGNKSKVGCCVCNMIWSLVFSRVCF